ncbi:MAG: CoA-binding protein [Oscillatoriales cyanobacterium RM1_1_9]|nr:CoA-binding protein [Oscillatoriales cyanobacterium SM2_3_0]NJO47289.1 CoA-binding protein [Oscillatoriales cyanobacterium RM2_1_1]NJO71191.1 CoA-binding protein [Oscillatoriales cyanobacterium RM1_1_9]
MNLTSDSTILIQGITASCSALYAGLKMKEYGTRVVACVHPGQDPQPVLNIPTFDLVKQAQRAVGTIDISIIFTHPYQALDAALEAIAAGIRQLIIITEGMPPLDMVKLIRVAEMTETLLLGPNSSGIIVPGKLLLGTHPPELYTPGNVGVIGRSSTLTYEVVMQLTQANQGQSICVTVGSDVVIGSSLLQWLQILDEDDTTDVIVLVGEVDGGDEIEAASYIAEAIDKPVVAYIAGQFATKTQMVSQVSNVMTSRIMTSMSSQKEYQTKIAQFKGAKIPIAQRPAQIPGLVKQALGQPR